MIQQTENPITAIKHINTQVHITNLCNAWKLSNTKTTCSMQRHDSLFIVGRLDVHELLIAIVNHTKHRDF